jgi:hypothetical protein
VLWLAGAWREELIQLLDLLAERADRRLHPLPWTLPVPLRVHGHYSRAEIEAAFGVLTTESPWIHREGVLAHQASATDLLFITLRKSEAHFSPSTRYRDLALGPLLFHMVKRLAHERITPWCCHAPPWPIALAKVCFFPQP